MNAPAAHDAFLVQPLDGVQLVEASAGTGKTFTLATLVTRLVVERGLRIGQVLAVTYTEAATQELRRRIRERMDLAARVAEGDGQVLAGADKEALAINRVIVDRHVAAGGESREQLALRLRQAALETDLAAIFTIHGFCARVLRDHALACGQAFDAPTMVGNDTDLREEVGADVWRAVAADPEWAPHLRGLWSSPALLSQDLRALLSREPLLPVPAEPGVEPREEVEVAAHVLRAAFAEHGEQLHADLEAAIQSKVLRNNVMSMKWLDDCWRDLLRWHAIGDAFSPLDERAAKLTAAALCKHTSNGNQAHTPTSPLCEAVEQYLSACAAHRAWSDSRQAVLLHRVREQARTRMAELKRVRRLQTYDDMIDGVADALGHGDNQALVAALRSQYHVALVDEFQDTDPRQWAIFASVFGCEHDGQPPALFLVGDPKQAIYGFRGGDLHTYLAAREREGTVLAPALDRNFRSRPTVLRAIECLYDNAQAGGGEPFVESRIRFVPVQSGLGPDPDTGEPADAAYLRNGGPAHGLTVHTLQSDKGGFNADASREAATRACVAEIHAVLGEARAGTALLKGQPVEPGDIAVLVRSHREATLVQKALSAAGIPSVAAGKRSLFETDEAMELLALFESLLQPADDSRLRTALATVLLGVEAEAIASLDEQAQAHAGFQRDAQARRERWQRSGPLALVSDLCAVAAERLLGLFDGERRLTNYLQLAELMQEAQADAPGLHAQLAWLRNAIADADRDDEAQLLRLESDADRVQVVTLHKSKGLEYPLVFLPFVGIGGNGRSPQRHCVVHDGARRVLHWKVDKASQDWQHAVEEHKQQQRGEDARLLYVGLTRARHALWLAAGKFHGAANSPLAAMLDEQALARCPDILLVGSAVPEPPIPLQLEGSSSVQPARSAARGLSRDWWVYSFTQLMKAGAGDARTVRAMATGSETGAADEPVATEGVDAGIDDHDPRFSGARFGDVLHDAFEHVDFQAWAGWRGGAAPPGQAAALREALQRGGYVDRDLDDGIAALLPLVGHGLVTELPEGVRLCELPAQQRRAEMEFHFAMQPTAVDALIALLHRHGVLRERDGFGARRTLEGLMTGKIDLTYTAAGRWYVLDYKSNRLPGYDPPALAAAMLHSGYDLQALVYTVALHRWLRFRLGEAYDYARDFGGIRYLFCRGLAAGGGIHAAQPAPELVHALDAMFAGGGQ